MATATRRTADDDIKKARARALTYLRREANANRQRALDEAAEAIKRAHIAVEAVDPRVTLARVVLDHARDVTEPVLASLGLTPLMNLTTTSDGRPRASTDYTRIDVSMPLDAFPADYPTLVETSKLLTITKGLIYHETGHLLFSTPFEHLVRSAAQQGCQMPREFTNTKFQSGIAHFRWVQNVLEDQRMECAMVRLSPVFENHFRVTASSILIQPAMARGRVAMMWPYLCGRTYLPKNLLSAIRTDTLQQSTVIGLRDAFHTIETAVRAYKRATTHRELFEAVIVAAEAFGSWFDTAADQMFGNLDTHRDPGHDANTAVRRDLLQSATDDGDDDSESAGESTTPTSGVEAAQALRDLISSTITDSVRKTGTRAQVDDVLTSFNIQMGRGMPRDPTIAPMNPVERRQAHTVKAGMLDVLQPLMTRSDPGWTFRREYGVLDPVTFSLRSPGDTDYWTDVDRDLTPGREIAISLLLDVSYSMGEQIDELCVAAIGVRLACEELGIPCTVTSFASDASLVFDAFEPTDEIVLSCQGGTEPLKALDDLVNQRQDKAFHLVVVFTDGEWAGVPSMGPFRQPGATYIGVSLGEAAKRTLNDRHFDGVISIERAGDLVVPVQQLLAECILKED